MGLKTTNFEAKKMGEVLPEAYAIIRKIVTGENGQGVATIGVHRTRELASNPNIKPFHEEKIYFTVVRNVNDRETVYKKATTPYKSVEPNEEIGKDEEVIKYPFFYGWENDIISGE